MFRPTSQRFQVNPHSCWSNDIFIISSGEGGNLLHELTLALGKRKGKWMVLWATANADTGILIDGILHHLAVFKRLAQVWRIDSVHCCCAT